MEVQVRSVVPSLAFTTFPLASLTVSTAPARYLPASSVFAKLTPPEGSSHIILPFASMDGVRVGNAQETQGKTGVTVLCFPDSAKTGVDISGGGVRFISDTRMQDANYLFLIFPMELNGQKQMVELMAKVIALNFNPDLGTFTYRMKFVYKDTKMQEKIVRFIFEEERRIRKKELG